jgi:hypothetical protein
LEKDIVDQKTRLEDQETRLEDQKTRLEDQNGRLTLTEEPTMRSIISASISKLHKHLVHASRDYYCRFEFPAWIRTDRQKYFSWLQDHPEESHPVVDAFLRKYFDKDIIDGRIYNVSDYLDLRTMDDDRNEEQHKIPKVQDLDIAIRVLLKWSKEDLENLHYHPRLHTSHPIPLPAISDYIPRRKTSLEKYDLVAIQDRSSEDRGRSARFIWQVYHATL